MGLLGPIIIKAKIIIQLLWKAEVSWDSSVPANIHTMWLEFKEQLPLLSTVSFKRFIITLNSIENQIHGFCDASENAYGACIYLCSTDSEGNHHVSLMCAKSHVAPVNPLTLPCLELCAAILLSRLYIAVKQALPIQIDETYLWSDSTITLHWINTEPYLLKTVVSNRIAEIQRLSEACVWKHVPTQDNPVNLISRGQTPQEFLNSNIWQNGPPWLSQEQSFWPDMVIQINETPERKKIIASVTCTELKLIDDEFLKKFSSISKLKLPYKGKT